MNETIIRPPARLIKAKSGITYGFHTHAEIKLVGGFRFQLLAVLRYTDLSGKTHEIPVDSITDFSSSWVGQYSFLPRQFLVCESAILHDRFYKTHEVDRERADFLFREALNSQNATEYIQFKAYRGVRLFGKKAWDNHTDLPT